MKSLEPDLAIVIESVFLPWTSFDERSVAVAPSEVATPCIGDSSTRLLSKEVLICSPNNFMRSVLLDASS